MNVKSDSLLYLPLIYLSLSVSLFSLSLSPTTAICTYLPLSSRSLVLLCMILVVDISCNIFAMHNEWHRIEASTCSAAGHNRARPTTLTAHENSRGRQQQNHIHHLSNGERIVISHLQLDYREMHPRQKSPSLTTLRRAGVRIAADAAAIGLNNRDIYARHFLPQRPLSLSTARHTAARSELGVPRQTLQRCAYLVEPLL